MANKTSVKVSFRLKLKAWWEGYDVRDIEARLKAIEEKRKKDLEQAKKPEPEAPVELDPELPVSPWDDARVQIAQYIWGDGYCGPGGPEHIIAMSKLLALSPEMSMMVIGAGLGGPGRVLADEFGVWITGFEESEKLAQAGMELSTMAGLAKKAPVKHYDPTAEDAFERNFDRALARDCLYTIADKPDLLRKINAKLKIDGLFLATDYTISENAYANEDFEKWRAQEPIKPRPVLHDEETEMFEKAGFSLRVNENISDQYISLITSAWSEVDKVIAQLTQQGSEGKALINTLLKEAELWSIKTRLLESGDLQVWRLLASKKTSKTMSDW